MIYDIAGTPEGDLDATAGGRLVRGIEAIAAVLRIRYATFLGEYFLDNRRGVPWQRWRENKATPAILDEIRAVFAAETLAVPGVVRITPPGVSAEFDAATRTITIELTAIVRDDVLTVTAAVSPYSPAGVVITIIGASGAIMP